MPPGRALRGISPHGDHVYELGSPRGGLAGRGAPRGGLAGRGAPRGGLAGRGAPRGGPAGRGAPRGGLAGRGAPRGGLAGRGAPRGDLAGRGAPRGGLAGGRGAPRGGLAGGRGAPREGLAGRGAPREGLANGRGPGRGAPRGVPHGGLAGGPVARRGGPNVGPGAPRVGPKSVPRAVDDDRAATALRRWGLEMILGPLSLTARLRSGGSAAHLEALNEEKRKRRRARRGPRGVVAGEAAGRNDVRADEADDEEDGGGDAAPESSRGSAMLRETSAERHARFAQLEGARQHAIAMHALKHAVLVIKRHAEAAAKRVAEGKAMRQVVRRATRADALRFRAFKVKRKQLLRANCRERKHFAAQRVALIAERDARLQAARAEPKRDLAALRVAVQRCRRWLAKAKARAARLTAAKDRGHATRAKLKVARAQNRLTAAERQLKDCLARHAVEPQDFPIPTPAIRVLSRRQCRGWSAGIRAVLGRGGVVLRRGTMGRLPKTRRVDPEPQPRR